MPRKAGYVLAAWRSPDGVRLKQSKGAVGPQTALLCSKYVLTVRSKSMDFKNVRHLREILVTDAHGKATSKMQYSSQNTSHFRPNFVDVPPNDQTRARELYVKWGGIRRAEMRIGITVVIPDRAKRESESYEYRRAE
jgi:hypothetical protein